MMQSSARRFLFVLWLGSLGYPGRLASGDDSQPMRPLLPLVPIAQREGEVVQSPLPAALEPAVATEATDPAVVDASDRVDLVFGDVFPPIRVAERPSRASEPVGNVLSDPVESGQLNLTPPAAPTPAPEPDRTEPDRTEPDQLDTGDASSAELPAEVSMESATEHLESANDVHSESNVTQETPTTVRPAIAMPTYVSAVRAPIEQSLRLHANIRLNSGDDSCWSMMHSFLGWGAGTEIHVGGPRGQRTNAIRWVASNQPCANRRLWYLQGDRIKGREGPGYQGHPAQFLAMIAQCNVDPSLELRAGNRQFTVHDLIADEQLTCSLQTELTFKLMGLVHYLSTDAAWVNERGEAWSIERLLAVELSQPVNGAACGGTHRLMAISYALEKRRQEGRELNGVWGQAQKYISDYHRYTMSLQNRDGSFSSDWFRRRADWGDLDRRIQTTGHMLEWLVFSLPEEDLYDPRVVRAVNFLAQSLIQHRHRDFEVGPKGHTVRALRLYHERVFQGATLQVAPLARRQSSPNER